MANKNFFKEIVNQKNSIFIKILVPTIMVVLLQVILISLVLILNGTVKSLEDSTAESLYRNAQNRSITLENTMVHTWSNIDMLETDLSAAISDHMKAGNLSPADVFGVSAREKELLALLSDAVIYTMRTTATTGAFVFFVNEQATSSDTAALNGLYYRDFSPIMNSATYRWRRDLSQSHSSTPMRTSRHGMPTSTANCRKQQKNKSIIRMSHLYAKDSFRIISGTTTSRGAQHLPRPPALLLCCGLTYKDLQSTPPPSAD